MRSLRWVWACAGLKQTLMKWPQVWPTAAVTHCSGLCSQHLTAFAKIISHLFSALNCIPLFSNASILEVENKKVVENLRGKVDLCFDKYFILLHTVKNSNYILKSQDTCIKKNNNKQLLLCFCLMSTVLRPNWLYCILLYTSFISNCSKWILNQF